MHVVGVFEAKNRLTALLGEVEEGGEVLITRRGRPVARLVPAEPGFDRAKAVAPQLWPIEALNGLLTAERRGRITGAARQRLAAFLQDLPIRIDDATAARVWTSTILLADQHRLTVYDAA